MLGWEFLGSRSVIDQELEWAKKSCRLKVMLCEIFSEDLETFPGWKRFRLKLYYLQFLVKIWSLSPAIASYGSSTVECDKGQDYGNNFDAT